MECARTTYGTLQGLTEPVFIGVISGATLLLMLVGVAVGLCVCRCKRVFCFHKKQSHEPFIASLSTGPLSTDLNTRPTDSPPLDLEDSGRALVENVDGDDAGTYEDVNIGYPSLRPVSSVSPVSHDV